MERTFLFITLLYITLFTNVPCVALDKNASLVQDILSQTNQFRKSKGLPQLIIRRELNLIAQQHSVDMAIGSVGFGHDGFAKRNSMASKVITPLFSFAENVAYGAASARDVVTMWKNSSGHRRNMLGRYKYIGIGISRDRQGRLFYTQIFAA